jgi:DNA topoisomerase I
MSDESGVWRRVETGKGTFRYLRADGKPLKSKAALERIRKLAIPPGWRDVVVSSDAGAKIQAFGVDAAGRKQYIYHPDFVARRDRKKFRKLLDFARTLPELRRVTNAHLKQKGLSRERVLATVVRLMSRAYFRIGSERYAVSNKTYGIATLRKRHLEIRGNDLIFRYKGKRSLHQRKVVADTPLVEVLREMLDLPGDRLFRYVGEEGRVRNVTARDVNEYLKEILGERYTSKDFRTWGGTVRAATILADLGPAASQREAEKNVVLTCKLVAAELGNTPAVCRSAYVHPLVFDKYLTGKTIEPVMRKTPRPVEAEAPVQFYPEEAALMRSLEGWSRR